VLGYRTDGGYAEIVKVPVQNLIAIPDAIGFVEAAAFPLAFLTAWHMLITRAKLRAGEDVLVLGAGSGVGQAAIQIAWRHGARVFATAGTDEKLAKARQLGAYEVINHTTQDLPGKVREFTGGRGVDVVVEHVGTATWDRSLKSLARAGRLVTCGATTGHDAQLDLRVLFVRQLSLLGSYMGRKAELLRAAQFFFAGELRPVVDKTFTLAEAAEAHRRLESREQFGKIVLTV
jgi:NADPH:quinone reductase-like Zn-dependent oxidoreductase